jgi:hypothetical protein
MLNCSCEPVVDRFIIYFLEDNRHIISLIISLIDYLICAMFM